MQPSGEAKACGNRRAVFLDRDGVINNVVIRSGRPYPPPDLESFKILPGVPDAVRRLKEAGFIIAVATNQPDVARGLQRRDVVDQMHRHISDMMPIDDFQVCYELEASGCDRYKPKPGMLLDTSRKFAIDLTRSFMVGDRWRDIGAARAAGCVAIFIDHGYSERLRQPPDVVVSGLTEAVDWILEEGRLRGEPTHEQPI